jgi:hypothetical protein
LRQAVKPVGIRRRASENHRLSRGIFESRTRWQERQGNQHPQPRDISAAYTNVCDSPNQ